MPVLAPARVTSNAQISDILYWITFDSPEIISSSRPGQFVHMINSDSQDPLLRRPYSLSAIDSQSARASILYHAVGRGSEWLARRRPGDLVDSLGPLGSTFRFAPGSQRVLMVGGGIGMGPLIALAGDAETAGIECVMLNGARTAEGLVPPEFIPVSTEFHTATDDGSFGARGSVVDLVEHWFGWCDQVFACGPNPMLRALEVSVKRLSPVHSSARKPVQMALEARMACGVGVCYSCVHPTRRGPKRVCTEGPVFDMGELLWDWESGV